jgi:hypothetical protein
MVALLDVAADRVEDGWSYFEGDDNDVCAKGGKFTVLLGEKGMQNVPNQRKCCTKREVGDIKIQAAQVGVRKKQIFEDGRGHEGPGPSMHWASCPCPVNREIRHLM